MRRNRHYGSIKGTLLTEDDIRRRAPSVFATEAHHSRSHRFTPIPTSSVVSALAREGFAVSHAAQSNSRDETRFGFAKHMLRFRKADAAPVQRLGQTFAEVVLVNANDGSSSYVLSAGLMRLVCLNGMTVSDKTFDRVRVSHMGDVIGQVIEGTYRVLDESIQALEHAEAWTGIDLNGGQQRAFAEAARVLRFGDAEGNVDTPITADQFLVPRRADDRRSDLWHTFNRVQENSIRGGLRGVRTDADGRRHNVTTREVRGIDQDQRLNRALWTLAEELAKAA